MGIYKGIWLFCYMWNYVKIYNTHVWSSCIHPLQMWIIRTVTNLLLQTAAVTWIGSREVEVNGTNDNTVVLGVHCGVLFTHDEVVAVDSNCSVETVAALESGWGVEIGWISNGIQVSWSWDMTVPTVWTEDVAGLCADDVLDRQQLSGLVMVLQLKFWTCDKFWITFQTLLSKAN